LGFGQAVTLRSDRLALLLTNNWLDNEMINAGMDYMVQELKADSSIALANSLLLEHLRMVRSRGSYFPSCNRLAQRIHNCQVTIIHFPVFVNGNHWTLLSVDIDMFTYSYSDSRSPSAKLNTGVFDTVQWWLHELRPDLRSNQLERSDAEYNMPTQTDSNSCGVVVLSTLAAHLFGYEPWTQESYASHRMMWFLRLSEAMQDSDTCENNGN
jgi:Ulp1 family protease